MDKSSFFFETLKACLLKFWEGYNKVNEVLAILFLVAITIVVFVAVWFRYVLRLPLVWSEEFAINGFIWLCFLGAGLAEKHGRHFRVTVLVERMKPKTRLVVDIFLHIILFVVLYRFFMDGLSYFEQGRSGITTVTQIPLSFIYAAVPVCAAILFLNRIKVFIDTIVMHVRMIKDQNYMPGKKLGNE